MKKGFTLVEVLIILAIIGLLAAIAVPSFLKARDQSNLNSLGLVSMYVSNGPNIIYDTETFLVVETSKHNKEVTRVKGKITSPTIEQFKSLKPEGALQAIKPLTASFLAKYPEKELIQFASGKKPIPNEFFRDLRGDQFDTSDLNNTVIKTKDEIIVSVAKKDRPEQQVALTFNGKVLAITHSKFPSQPESVVFNGVVYSKQNTTTEDCSATFQDSDKFKYVEGSFKTESHKEKKWSWE